ncbi:MAG: hypothetical protein WD766_08105 [Gemmatimonadota bacterium]
MFIRRDRSAPTSYVALRVGLFFFAAGLWLAGVWAGNELVTAVAMVIAVGTMFFSLYLRRQMADQQEEEMEEGDGTGW